MVRLVCNIFKDSAAWLCVCGPSWNLNRRAPSDLHHRVIGRKSADIHLFDCDRYGFSPMLIFFTALEHAKWCANEQLLVFLRLLFLQSVSI